MDFDDKGQRASSPTRLTQENKPGEYMADIEDAFKGIDKIIDGLKERSPKSKDYCKFLIGLSTGTLIFSVTFLREFGTSPEYKFILLIGWVCLLASIIAGVLLLPKSDQLEVQIENLKIFFKSPEVTVAIIKKAFRQHFLIGALKTGLDPYFKEDQKKKEEIIQFAEKLEPKDLNKFLEKLMLAGIKDSKFISWSNQFFNQLFKFISMAEKITKSINPVVILKSLRMIILQIVWLNRVMIYGFFAGILAISVFSVINFID